MGTRTKVGDDLTTAILDALNGRVGGWNWTDKETDDVMAVLSAFAARTIEAVQPDRAKGHEMARKFYAATCQALEEIYTPLEK